MDREPAAPAQLNASLEQLRRFVVVAEQLHFTRAAEQLHVSQQALSSHIRQLEQQVGADLLRRTTRRVELTEAGQVLLDGARRALAGLDDAVQAARRRADGLGRVLRVAVGTDTEYVAHPTLDRFTDAVPGVEIVRTVGYDADNLRAVRAGDADAAFVWGVARPPHGLRRTVVVREEVWIAVPSGHPLADYQRIPRAEFVRQPLVIYRRDLAPTAYDTLLDRLYGPEGVTPEIAEVVDGTQHFMLQRVAAGKGVCPCSPPTIRPATVDGVELRPLEPATMYNIELVSVDPPSPEVAQLTELIAPG